MFSKSIVSTRADVAAQYFFDRLAGIRFVLPPAVSVSRLAVSVAACSRGHADLTETVNWWRRK